MNRAYRVIFNHATGVWQCVSELARSKGKSKSFKALALVSAVMASSQAMAVDIEFSDGQKHYHNPRDTELSRHVVIANPGTQAIFENYLVIGNYIDTNLEISNQAQLESRNGIDIAGYSNTLVSMSNATMRTHSDDIHLAYTEDSNAKLNAIDSLIIVGNQSINNSKLVVGDSGIGEIAITGKSINPTSYPYNQYSSDLAVYGDAIIGALPNSQGKINIDGYTGFNVTKNLIIGAGGQGEVTFNKNSPESSGHTRADKIYLGGYEDLVNNAQTTNGKGTLSLIDSDLTANEIVVGNTGSGTLNLRIGDVDNFISTLTVNQISRNPNSQLSEIYLDGGEISIELDQPNLFANFTKDNKIEIGEKGIGFVTGDHRVNNPTSANVTIDPNAVITGNAGSFDINNPDIPGGFFKSGVGTLTISENTKQFAGDIAITRGTLKIDGNYTMNGENLIIGLIDWNSDDTFDNKDEYGKLIVTGKADVSNGNLAVYVDEFIKNGITANTVVKDVVTADKLVGQFKQVTDNSPLVTFYADYSDPNKVHLTLVKPANQPEPVVPPTVEPATPPVTPPVVEQPVTPPEPTTPETPVEQPSEQPVEPPTKPTPPVTEPTPAVRDVNFVTAVNENHNTDSTALAAHLDQIVADGSALSDALLRDTVNFDSAKLSQAVSELEPLMMGATNRILRDVSHQAVQALFDPTISRERAFWAKLIGKDGQLDAKNTGLLGYDNTDFGAITGIDTMLDRTRVGIAIAYVQSDAESTDRHDHSLSAKSKFGMIYADHDANDATRIYGQVAIGRSDIEGERKLSTLTQAIAKSDYQADIINAGLGVEYRLGNSTRNITPFARLDYAHIRADGYQETGAGAYNLSIDKQSYETLRTTIGAKFNQVITPKLGITGTLAAAYDSGDDTTYISAGFDGAGSSTRFVTASDATDRTIGIAGLGINYQLTPMASLSAGYQGQWQSGYDSHSANIGFKVQF